MKTETTIVFLLAAGLLTGCSGLEKPHDTAPYISVEAQFIPDKILINNPKTRSLEEFAMTLPVFETGDPVSWIESGPGATHRENEWIIHPDGAQAPIRIERLEPSKLDVQRIRVSIGPNLISQESPPPIWVHELERAEGGWKKLRSYKRSSNEPAHRIPYPPRVQAVMTI